MFDAIRDRWKNRGVRCLKCQKKLVAKEKLVCKECKRQLANESMASLLLLGLVAFIKPHNNRDKD